MAHPIIRPGLKEPLKAGVSSFRAAFVPLLLFEALYKAATYIVINPLMGLLMQLLLRLGGDELAFNDEIWRFALSLPGILAILLLAALATLLIYFEFSVVISLLLAAGDAANHPAQAAIGTAAPSARPSIRDAIVRATWSLGALKGPSAILLCLYLLVLMPLVNSGITSSLLPRLSIPNFITGEAAKTALGGAALWAAGALAALVFLGLLFVLPAMVAGRVRFGAAVKGSLSAIGVYKWHMLVVLLCFGVLWAALFFLPRQLFTLFFGTANVAFSDIFTLHGLSLRIPILLLVWLVGSFLQIILTPAMMALLAALYVPLTATGSPQQPPPEDAARIRAMLDKFTGWLQRLALAAVRLARRGWRRVMAIPFVQKHKKLLGVALALVLLWGIVNTLATTTLYDPIVIGHRGSAYGVENTLEAIQHAIDAEADYAEVDVLLSKDNVPMVVHDANLQRLSGQNLNVYDLTAEELARLELRQEGYTGRISTLAEVVDYCEGKILLAVEYKLHGHETTDLVDATMAVMKGSEFQQKSIYLSLDYGLVARMKELYPTYLTGYCVYGNVGTPSTGSLLDLEMDFLLVEEWMATKDFVNACRRAWLPVFVWTVNDSRRMEEYLDIGVRGLVTDYPDTGIAVLRDRLDLELRVMPHDVE